MNLLSGLFSVKGLSRSLTGGVREVKEVAKSGKAATPQWQKWQQGRCAAVAREAMKK